MVFGTPTKGRRFGGFREYRTVKINVKVAVSVPLQAGFIYKCIMLLSVKRVETIDALFRQKTAMQFTLIMKKQFN